MIAFAIQIFKVVRTQFTLLIFQTRRVDLEVHFAALSIVSVMFNLVRSIILYTSKALKSACKHYIFLFPAVLILENFQIYVHFSYSCDIVSDIKTSVDETLSFSATLYILYIYLDNSHIQFWRHFNDSWFECKKDIIKDMCRLNDGLNNTKINKHISIFQDV